ncbi:MAG TPA: element excision factor XisI family protein [Blastocatellia bacterium]|nr:element excision factor XisI family protein [Blastocatellia bacterium]
MNYADILTRVIHEEGKYQPSFQPKLKVVSACDRETGQFLLIWVGCDKERWVHSILFHAQLIDGKVIIEKDLTEEGLKPLLIEEGIPEEAFLSERDRDEARQIAA